MRKIRILLICRQNKLASHLINFFQHMNCHVNLENNHTNAYKFLKNHTPTYNWVIDVSHINSWKRKKFIHKLDKTLNSNYSYLALNLKEISNNIALLNSTLNNLKTNMIHFEHHEESLPSNNYEINASILNFAYFRFKNISGAKQACLFLSYLAKDPNSLFLGLWELSLNAIQHGNLELSYHLKSNFLSCFQLDEEINKRLGNSTFEQRFARIYFYNKSKNLNFEILDEGKGFNWKEFLNIDVNRVSHHHGRGIALSYLTVFHKLHYNKKGNKVSGILLKDN